MIILYILIGLIGLIMLIKLFAELETELKKQGLKREEKEKKHILLKSGIIGASVWCRFCKDAKKRK